jgi:hypothetical protein
MAVNRAPIETRLLTNKDISDLKVRAFALTRLSWNADHIGNADDGEEESAMMCELALPD